MKATTIQYVGIDLHQATNSVCIRDVDGKITQMVGSSAICGAAERFIDGL